MNSVTNIAAYKFTALDRLSHRRKALYALGKSLGLRGTILLSPEGINLFLAGDESAVQRLLDHVRQDPPLADLQVKFSVSDRIPFRRLLVKIKPEIITFAIPGIDPARTKSPKLPAHTLKQWLDAGKTVTLLDVRNDYEVKIGAFANARPIGISHFRQFPAAVDQLPEELKQQPLVMYCTGGIRCEKAGPLMQQKGFQQVFQLDGGILKYFEECGGAHYEGECFVFDQRVALDTQLQETDTTLCFACQATLSADEQQSPLYVVGKSCPFCYQTPQETVEATCARRHEQIRHVVTPLPGCEPYENRRPIAVPQRCDGYTLQELLVDLHPHVGATEWQTAIDQGRLQRNGESLAADDRVVVGERIENVLPMTVEPEVNADIQILYEDAMLVVVNKPAPLPMHPCGRYNRNTLIWILDHVYRPQRLRVAHRLDANTTGVVVLSRNRPIAGQVQPQFERGEVEKRYLAKIRGVPAQESFSCDAPIADVAQRAGRREVDVAGLPSRTEFRVLHRFDDQTSLVEARPLTGRTNQIRLHLAHLGWPVCGDPTYGTPTDSPITQTLHPTDPPLCLHAWQIGLRHPLDGKRIHFVAPAPEWAHAVAKDIGTASESLWTSDVT